MPQHREALRTKAQLCRRAAAEAKTQIAQHLYLTAAKRYDAAATEALAAFKSETRAARYERDPGGGPSTPPPL